MCYITWVINRGHLSILHTYKEMKQIALAALALSALATPAFAGPYVESKHEFKGTDDDYKKTVHQGRVGYETKLGALKPYIEAGLGVSSPMVVVAIPSRHWKSAPN